MCHQKTKQKILTFKDPGGGQSVFILNNPDAKNLISTKVDSGLLDKNDPRLKCDFLFRVQKGKALDKYFLELKGKDVEHAAKQLHNSIRLAEVKILDGELRKCFIVSSKVPLAGGDLALLKLKFKKENACELVIKNLKLEFIV